MIDNQTRDAESSSMVAAESRATALELVVVEDSALVRESLIRLVSMVPGVRVVGETGSVPEAIRLISEYAPDLITLDLRLLDGSGLDVLRAIRGRPRKPRVAVLSNNGDPRVRRECLALGADFFFDKSMQLNDLRETLTQLASQRDAEPWKDASSSL